eukprot:scaffold348489_cov28-Prasinocladus_malaysianus.AAC.2
MQTTIIVVLEQAPRGHRAHPSHENTSRGDALADIFSNSRQSREQARDAKAFSDPHGAAQATGPDCSFTPLETKRITNRICRREAPLRNPPHHPPVN